MKIKFEQQKLCNSPRKSLLKGEYSKGLSVSQVRSFLGPGFFTKRIGKDSIVEFCFILIGKCESNKKREFRLTDKGWCELVNNDLQESLNKITKLSLWYTKQS